MADRDEWLDSLAGAVLDGSAVDWTTAGAGADAETRPLIDHLRSVESVAAVLRGDSDAEARGVWGHLRLIEPIGRGSFGEVYRAWDTRLEREVALKLLPAEPATPPAPAIAEGRLLARVRHEGVVTIHGADHIGEHVGLWMELINGRTLEESLESGATFTPDDVTRIGIDLAGAVQAVHDAGLVHRDIKAQNVMREAGGRVVLMDFGAGAAREQGGQELAGTPLYLAPEVLAGAPATPRTDVYSLGVLLFHLLTRSFPVRGASVAAVRQAHDAGRARTRDVRPDVPARLARAIDRALDPDPARRHESAVALATELGAIRHRARRARWALALAVAVLASAAVWMFWPAPPPVIAVQPFLNLTPSAGADALVEGLTHEVVAGLSRIEGWRVQPLRAAVAGGDGEALETARRTGADFVLSASVVASAGHLRLITRLVNARTGTTDWARTFDSGGGDVFAVLDEMALSLVNQLRLDVGGGQRRYQTDPALELQFLRARGLQIRRQTAFAVQAVALFEEIVRQDPSFAPAVAALARSLGDVWHLNREVDLGTIEPRLERAVLEAIRLDQFLAESQAALGIFHTSERHWAEAEAAFERALAIDGTQGSIYSDYVLALLLPLGRLEDASDVMARGRRAAPASLDVARIQALVQVESGRYAEAIANARWVLDQDPEFPFTDIWLGRALLLSGQPAEAEPIFARRPGLWNYLGHLYAITGRTAEAEALAAEHPGEDARLMMIYAGLGDVERAMAALERTAVTNPWRAATWMIRPEVAILRDDPRYQAIRRQLSLPD